MSEEVINVKNGNEDETVCEEVEQEENIPVFQNAIAHPLAGVKLEKRISRLLVKSFQKKDKLIRGLKNVQTSIRKGAKGICILAADVTPIEVYCHLPIVCEDQNIPYCFVSSKRRMSAALGVKRPCIVTLIQPDPDYKDLFGKCSSAIEKLK